MTFHEALTMHSLLSGTPGTAFVLASRTLLALALEWRLALMADHACALGDWLLNILSIGFDSNNALLLFWLLLCLSEGVTWAFLAATVVTILADFVDAEVGTAAMAGAVHPHANLLLNPRYIRFERRRPFADFQSHVVFREQCAYFLFLYLDMFRSSQG